MKVTVVSGFSPVGYEIYGRRFLQTFDQYWPASTDLVVYTEEPVDMPRGECRSLWSIPGAREFILGRHHHDPTPNGKLPNARMRPRETERGYSYRYDAVKFSRQGFIPEHAAKDRDGILVWLDADVRTLMAVPEELVPSVLGQADLAYLGRGKKHSEIGFLVFRLPGAEPLLKKFADLYREDEVFDLDEWHSAFVFDHARSLFPELKQRDMTPGGKGHVWLSSALYPYMDHLKGDRRKALGYSPERRANG